LCPCLLTHATTTLSSTSSLPDALPISSWCHQRQRLGLDKPGHLDHDHWRYSDPAGLGFLRNTPYRAHGGSTHHRTAARAADQPGCPDGRIWHDGPIRCRAPTDANAHRNRFWAGADSVRNWPVDGPGWHDDAGYVPGLLGV